VGRGRLACTVAGAGGADCRRAFAGWRCTRAGASSKPRNGRYAPATTSKRRRFIEGAVSQRVRTEPSFRMHLCGSVKFLHRFCYRRVRTHLGDCSGRSYLSFYVILQNGIVYHCGVVLVRECLLSPLKIGRTTLYRETIQNGTFPLQDEGLYVG
jgi:hypothetical protein